MDDMSQIYRQHARTVYKFLLAQCGNPHLAEELTQETFYQAVRSVDRFDGSCKISVWLCQIAKHLWYQHLRRAHRETPLPEEDSALPPLPSAEAEVCAREGQLDLLRRVHQLPEPGREIGDVLGKTETWARVTFYRCKERLRQGGDSHEK